MKRQFMTIPFGKGEKRIVVTLAFREAGVDRFFPAVCAFRL